MSVSTTSPSTLPLHITGRTLGVDQAGRPISRTKGTIIRFTIEYMLECVGVRAVQALPPDMNP